MYIYMYSTMGVKCDSSKCHESHENKKLDFKGNNDYRFATLLE